MIFKSLILSILLHIIDDFVFQPICLSKLKQKKYWEDTLKENHLDSKKYKYDYKCALLIHSISWSIMISLPVIFLLDKNNILISLIILINIIFHYLVDNEKANKLTINLWQDQSLHLFQIILLYIFML